jgi:hypothetical protein
VKCAIAYEDVFPRRYTMESNHTNAAVAMLFSAEEIPEGTAAVVERDGEDFVVVVEVEGGVAEYRVAASVLGRGVKQERLHEYVELVSHDGAAPSHAWQRKLW